MEVILLNDVDKVGLRGDVVDVARGYARNFLLPRRLAEPATPGRLAELRRRDSTRARHEAKSVDEARALAAKLEAAELRFDVKAGPTGSLFGSITATNLADLIWEKAKVRVDRRKIDLHDPIKRIGRYAVGIDLFQDVTVEVRTLVVPEGGELPPEEELEALAAQEAAVAEEAEQLQEAEHAEAEAAIEELLDEAEEPVEGETVDAAAEPGDASSSEPQV